MMCLKLSKSSEHFLFQKKLCYLLHTNIISTQYTNLQVSKDEFMTFEMKCILLDCMATKPARKIEQVLAMILRRIMVPLHKQLPNQML